MQQHFRDISDVTIGIVLCRNQFFVSCQIPSVAPLQMASK